MACTNAVIPIGVTTPSSLAFGGSSAIGSALDVARSDHTHGMPAAPSSTWNTISNPGGNQALAMAAYTSTWTWTANTSNIFTMTDGTAVFLQVNGTKTTDNQVAISLAAPAQTIAGAAGTSYNVVNIGAFTFTTSTATTITAMLGIALRIAQPTINQSGGAVVVTTASTLYVAGAPATGASVTVTNGYAIYIDNTPNIYMGAAAGTISLIANTQNSLKFTTSTIAGQAYLALDTRTTVSAIQAVSITPSAPTIASAAGSVYNVLYVTPPLITFSGTNTVTAMQGIGLSIGQVLYAGTAATVTTASTLYIYGGPTPGGSVTVTNSYAIYIANNSNIFLGGQPVFSS